MKILLNFLNDSSLRGSRGAFIGIGGSIELAETGAEPGRSRGNKYSRVSAR